MFRIKQLLAGLGLGVAVLAAGCGGGGGVDEKTVEVKQQDPMIRVKSTLERYAKGQPMTSEAASFDHMVEEVRKVDPAKADVLKAGLDDLKQTKGNIAPKAKALMKKLGLN
ncbi:MAG TPA: hypothetical protein VIL46_02485 [Gemmataceae bacterium]